MMLGADRCLVDTEWLEVQLNSSNVTIVETALDRHEYDMEHIPGSIFIPLLGGLLSPDFSLNLGSDAISETLKAHRIRQEQTVVVLGENAAVAGWLFWLLKMFGYPEVYILDGGRNKWIGEKRPVTRIISVDFPSATWQTARQIPSTKSLATRGEVLAALKNKSYVILDVRTKQEFTGEWFAQGPPEIGQRCGHIPGAINLPHELTIESDGTLKNESALRELFQSRGITPEKTVLCYCAAGFRSAFVWFVLSEILNFPSVKNYSGSWFDWSAAVSLPIENDWNAGKFS